MPIINITMGDTISLIEEMIEERSFHQIATANVDFLFKAMQDGELLEVLRGCDLVLADGMPLVWASKMMGTPLTERVCGSDLVPRLVELSAQKHYRIFLLGASEERSLGAARWIATQYPDAQLAGRYSPPFSSLEDMDHEYILNLVNASRADILLVAFGNPKQEKWLAMHRDRLKVPVCVGVGASIDFLSGLHSRAPMWMQKVGLEWFHRLIKEPRRLASRYGSNAVGLMLHLPKQVLAYARQSKSVTPSVITHSVVDGTLRITIAGSFTGSTVQEVQKVIRRYLTDKMHLLLNLEQTSYVGPDASGMVLHLSEWMRSNQRQIWLTGAQESLLRIHRASRYGEHILLAPDMETAMSHIAIADVEAAA